MRKVSRVSNVINFMRYLGNGYALDASACDSKVLEFESSFTFNVTFNRDISAAVRKCVSKNPH